MLTKRDKITINFIRETRNNLMSKDELHTKKEAMYSKLHNFENLVKNNPELNKAYVELEGLIIDALYLTEEKYFEYGSCYSTVIENQDLDDLVKED